MAGCYMEKGMYRNAEGVLRQSIVFADGPELRAMLGDAMMEQNDVAEAAANYAQVLQVRGHSLCACLCTVQLQGVLRHLLHSSRQPAVQYLTRTGCCKSA